jgi:hypothetical protein
LNEKIFCYSCNKTKNKLNLKKSSLLPINLFLCQTCIDEKLEPRWVVLIAGRQNGHEHVKEFIQKRKYIGSEITASELLI